MTCWALAAVAVVVVLALALAVIAAPVLAVRTAVLTLPLGLLLLGGGLVIVENLCLKKVVGRKDVMFFALPLKYAGADGAPVRAIAEFRDFPEKEMSWE